MSSATKWKNRLGGQGDVSRSRETRIRATALAWWEKLHPRFVREKTEDQTQLGKEPRA